MAPRGSPPMPKGGSCARGSSLSLEVLALQALNGLANASSLFFLSAGLSLIFGVSRVVNMAHGSLYMLGAYIAYTCASKLGGMLGFWGGLVATAAALALVGTLIEVLLLRRIYHVAELFQLLATFALVLLLSDVVAALWGVEDLLGRARPDCVARWKSSGITIPSTTSSFYCSVPSCSPGCTSCSPARAGARWCAPRRRIATWLRRSASTRPSSSPPSSPSARLSPALAARSRRRASRRISAWI